MTASHMTRIPLETIMSGMDTNLISFKPGCSMELGGFEGLKDSV
jgi:hypothetical protein